MILQALHDYYQRKMADHDRSRRLPAFGREDKEIPFILELDSNGQLVSITPTGQVVGKRKFASRYLVPKGVKKTSGIAANLLWDNAEYVLGVPDAKKLAEAERKRKAGDYRLRLNEMQAAFRARIATLGEAIQEDEGIRAVLAFLASKPAEQVASQSAWREIADSNPILSFRLTNDIDLICQRPAVSAAADSAVDGQEQGDEQSAGESASGVCLLTGDRAQIERLHTSIKGVWGAQSSGANIVSFNLDAFNSFGKSQGANAPVSQAASFGYTTALNHLLDKNSRQRLQVGDASTIFWSQRAGEEEMEDWFGESYREPDDPDAHTEKMRALLEAIKSGRFDGGRGRDMFYVLGLAPNAARISVRFWHAVPLFEVARRTQEWFEDLRVVRGPNDAEYPSLFRLLLSAAVLGKADNLPPKLGGEVLRSALDGSLLPMTLLQAVLQRCRADQAKKTDTGKPVANVSYHRAALLKACLNRLIRNQQLATREITVPLDTANKDPSYLFGRLFSAYERIQSDAAGRDLNRTVRDTYFGAAMSNPATVFPRLIQLNQFHMRDVKRRDGGLHVVRDKPLNEIWDKLEPGKPWPNMQPLPQRALFAMGYYHQRQSFFTKSEAPSDVVPTAETKFNTETETQQ